MDTIDIIRSTPNTMVGISEHPPRTHTHTQPTGSNGYHPNDGKLEVAEGLQGALDDAERIADALHRFAIMSRAPPCMLDSSIRWSTPSVDGTRC